VVNLKQYIARQHRTRRKSNTTRRHMSEDSGDVGVTRSPGLDAATVALPADIDLEARAARMNAFWDKLVEFQHRDVLVVALCVGDEL
jgi:hypothetical protein